MGLSIAVPACGNVALVQYIWIQLVPKWHIQDKYITNEDDKLIPLRSMSTILAIFVSDIFFPARFMRNVLLFLSIILYELWPANYP